MSTSIEDTSPNVNNPFTRNTRTETSVMKRTEQDQTAIERKFDSVFNFFESTLRTHTDLKKLLLSIPGKAITIGFYFR